MRFALALSCRPQWTAAASGLRSIWVHAAETGSHDTRARAWHTARPVSWLLLGFGVLSALATLNAFWPVRTPLLAIVGFFAGWLTIELALHSLIAHAVVLAWLCAGGGLAEWPGVVGLVLALGASVGLFALHLRSLRAVVTLREF